MITALLALDIGGSTSRATLVDMAGNCLGQGKSRGGNPGSNPPDQAAAAIIAAAEAAVADAGVPLNIVVALLAMAGPNVNAARTRIEAAFRALGLSGPLVFSGDLNALLPSVTAATSGYCVVCGTGAGAVRVRDGEIERVADAAGWLLGDLGSGYWLGHQAAIAITAALEGRGPETALTKAILGALDIPLTGERAFDGRPLPLRLLIDAIYAMPPIELAKFAPLVIANRDDAVAAGLLAQSERYLLADFQQVFNPGMPGPVVLAGGIAAHLTGLPAAIAQVMRTAGHEPDIRLSGDGSVGAAVLALRHQGVTVDEAMLIAIAASVKARAAKAITPA
ncbi:glucosamine kinase [Devosia sp. UYZn731]|uniref:N-acetylglucosamine kinase n=1 Tax=Devosia sp. UYZn731 TaxID=3156345 RepID=UPI00339A64A1